MVKSPVALGAVVMMWLVLVGILLNHHFTSRPKIAEKFPEVRTKLEGGEFHSMATVIHDGHKFVILGYPSIIHHPSCPCLTK